MQADIFKQQSGTNHNEMQRIAFRMQLKRGCEVEYKKRHDSIWPELSMELHNAGIRDYSIFLDESTGTLFAFHRLIEKHSINDLPGQDIMKKWWVYMADIMETNPDHSPVIKPLKEVFHMD